MRKTILLLALSCFMSTAALAHVTTEETVYQDIAQSEAAADILLLDMLGVISAEGSSRDFRPHEPLLAEEFKAWMAGYNGTVQSHELGGDSPINYGQVNDSLFGGQVNLEQPEKTMSREEFAAFTADHADLDVNGANLFTQSGLKEGPSGKISAVTKTGDGYQLEIGGELYELGAHPRIHGGIADPAVWEGMEIANTWLGPEMSDGQSEASQKNGTEEIQYAEIQEPAVELVVEETENGPIVKADLDEKAGKVNGVTIIAVLCVALLIYWINKKKEPEIDG